MIRKKIFFIAHEISPCLGSECSSGWNVVRGLSKYHDLTIVYAKTNQFETENYEEQINNFFISNSITKDAIFIALAQPRITKLIASLNKYISNKKSSTGNSILYFLAYKFWQKKAYKLFLLEDKKNNFEIVHQFNALSFREPGYLYKADVPLFWGPVSGLDNMPFSFLVKFPFTMAIKNLTRNISNDFQFYMSGRIKKTIKKAKTIYAVTNEDYIKLHKLNSNTFNLLDVGATIKDYNIKRTFNKSNEKLRCIWVGRLDRLKALDILIECIHQSEKLQQSIEISIVGDGVYKDEYVDLCNKYMLTNIKFIGSVDKVIVDELMTNSHILIHTSIKEAASAVILEGLASGLPVICHDAFGMSHAITDTCGIKIIFKNKRESIFGFKKALEQFLDNPNLVENLSDGSYKRAVELSWNSLVQKISNDYAKI